MFGDPFMKQLIKILLLSSLFIMIDDWSSSLLHAQDAGAVVDESEGSLSVENVHQINLNTADIQDSTSGNWLEKRIWFERAEKSFDEIRAVVSSISDIRIQFSNEVNAVGQKIDTFFETVDFTKNQLEDTFRGILSSLETEQKLTGDLSEAERTLQETIKKELGTIEQIGKDIKVIGDVDNKIDQTLMQAFKTIDECREYETKSWDTFKAIGKELDDKNARNLYYQMNNFKQNIEQKSTYLKTTLLPYLHNVLVAKIDTNIAKINKTIDELKTKGIDIQKLMGKTQEDDLTEIQKNEKSAKEIAVQKALEQERALYEKEKQEAAKKLEEERKKSFGYQLQQYYEASIGKMLAFFGSLFENTPNKVDLAEKSEQKLEQKSAAGPEEKGIFTQISDYVVGWYESLMGTTKKDAKPEQITSSQMPAPAGAPEKQAAPVGIPAPTMPSAPTLVPAPTESSTPVATTNATPIGSAPSPVIATPVIAQALPIAEATAGQAVPLENNVVVQFLEKPAEQQDSFLVILQNIIDFFSAAFARLYDLLATLMQSFLNFALQSTAN